MADVILIDGRSGAGKTELAEQIADAILGAQVVHLDDLYPGWDGLDAGSAAVPSLLTTYQWRSWDWATSQPGRSNEIDETRPIIVEGVGALSRASRPFARLAIWVELDDSTRKVRALARDGQSFEPFWDRWAAQELGFIAREHPRSLADVIVNT